MRAGELCDLEADAVTSIGGGWWLRVPLGKLHNDRYVPLHPQLVELLATGLTGGPTPTGLLLTATAGPSTVTIVARMLNRIAKAAGIGHVHPHQLRHTLATQAINRGMRLEAIAALLGHRSLRMTMVYARIANRTVADEYAAAQARVDALYAEPEPLPTPRCIGGVAEHRRMLGNGYCTRPRNSTAASRAICEGCGFFETTVEFRPTLRRQRDHADAHGQTARAELYDGLLPVGPGPVGPSASRTPHPNR